MNSTSTHPTIAPIGHIHDPVSMGRVLVALRKLHGPSYKFATGVWQGSTRLSSRTGRTSYRFIVDAEEAAARLLPGNLVAGPEANRIYGRLCGEMAVVQTEHAEDLWPGDVICLTGDESEIWVEGRATYFEVETVATAYGAPHLALLRYLVDRPGGCAAYPGAFRREALPPDRSSNGTPDQRGVNRVNEHTLDMRFDRLPTPIRHFHGPVAVGEDKMVNHSETAIVLPRALYGLPEVTQENRGHIVVYPDPVKDPAEKVVVPVQPGSVVLTPASVDGVAGHCFEDCFAMLVAIPGFVAPYNMLD